MTAVVFASFSKAFAAPSSRTRALRMLVGLAVFSSAIAHAQPASVLEGVYNEAQATRGQALYYQHCLSCHGETLGGVDKAPQLAGPQFNSTWTGAPLSALVARILTMPPEKPGSLSQQESVDVLTYMLWYSGLPLGSEPLSSDNAALRRLPFQPPSAH